MLPLIPIAVLLLPDLIRLIEGDKTNNLATRAAGAVKAAVGTQDEAQAREKLADPAVAAQLETRLVEIALEAQKARAQAENDRRQSDFAKLEASLADTPAARSSLTNLADKGSPISWGRRWFPSSSGSAFSW